jgi:3-hydroxyisobutyrate dehydrogenase
VQFAASIGATLPVASSALACFEEADATGLGDADATTISVRWPQRNAAKSN